MDKEELKAQNAKLRNYIGQLLGPIDINTPTIIHSTLNQGLSVIVSLGDSFILVALNWRAKIEKLEETSIRHCFCRL